MHIAINARFLRYPATGSGQHLLHLTGALQEHDHSNTYVLLSPPPHVTGGMGERLARLWWEQVELVRQCRWARAQLLHCPYFSAPLISPAPTVVTIHDVIPLILREYRERLMNRAYTALVSVGARRARAVIAVSECSRQDIARTLRIPLSKIHVVGNAVDDSYRPTDGPRRLSEMRSRYGIGPRYILYLGGFDVRKNVYRLLEAYAGLPPDLRLEYPLVLAGRLHLLGHPLYPDPRPRIAELGLEGHVVVTGEVAEEDKPALYTGAAVFIWPSLYEGFGIPVLEAMACGCAVITSNCSSLPEVAGDGALLVDPRDTGALTHALAELLEDPRKREQLRERALRRASEFSWRQVAEQTMQVYRTAVA